MEELIHNGVLVPRYEWRRFHIAIRGVDVELNPKQEEMILAWVRKTGTDYAQDKVFVDNFFGDFCKELDLKEKLKPQDFDFSAIVRFVQDEREYKQNLSKEEKKRIALDRKTLREVNREKYGYAVVDGVKTEISNYVAEPSCIFMGRGQHPRRGKWKQGPSEEDIVLNLSPKAPVPEGNWKEIVWEPSSCWIAKWGDKLTRKIKYVWLGDSAAAKQEAEIRKFDKANDLEGRIGDVRKHIIENLKSEDPLRRKIATVSYLIDELKFRVGDEKDKNEADTIGATTLRPEHIKIRSSGSIVFDFLGKDSVRWHREVCLPEIVVERIKEFMNEAKSQIFKGVRSQNVSQFLDEIMPGLTAKLFRTYHATRKVRDYLSKAEVDKDDSQPIKKSIATLANLEAAITCNHKKKIPMNWEESLARKMQRLDRLKSKQTKKSNEAIKTLKLKIEIAKKTKDYNLRTSLKSYIDPRVYYNWGRKIDYDWKLYYPKTLHKKFSWVEKAGN